MANHNVTVRNLQQTLEYEANQTPTQNGSNPEIQHESALCGHIRAAWMRNKLHKSKVSLQLLSNLRARRGVYSASQLAVLQETGGLNIVWADLTETKCRAGSAWIREIVMPVGERAWSVESTPLPELQVEVRQALLAKAAEKAREAMQQIFQNSQQVLSKQDFRQMSQDIAHEMRDEMAKEYTKRAERAAARMEEHIADNMAQGGWDKAMDEFVEDFVTYKAAILMGPVYRRKRQLKWMPGYVPAVENEPVQQWARVSPFDVYPAPYATDCQTGDFIHRMRYRPNELYDLIGCEGYNDDEIRNALKSYRNGHLEGWIWTDAERYRLEQETLYEFLSPHGVIDGLHYWGSVPGWMLVVWGVSGLGKDFDPQREYEVDAIIIGPYVIRVAINSNPLHSRPYFKACYDAVPGAFWGRSVPDLCETHQKMCNAVACSLADNLSICSGPQFWVHADRLADGEDTTNIYPLKVWHLKSDPTAAAQPGIGVFQPQSNAEQLLKVYEQWEIRADDATGIPRYTYGNERVGGATDTASGLSMLMNNAAKGLRRAIANIDECVIRPSVYQAFIYEMIYGADPDAKGDCFIVPRGAAAILIKESAAQHRQQGLALVSGNPVLTQIVGQKGMTVLLRETLKSMELDVDNIVPSDQEIAKQQADQQQQMAAQQQAQQQALQQQEAQKQQATQAQTDSRERVAGAQIAGKLEVEKLKLGLPPTAAAPQPQQQAAQTPVAPSPPMPAQPAEV